MFTCTVIVEGRAVTAGGMPATAGEESCMGIEQCSHVAQPAHSPVTLIVEIPLSFVTRLYGLYITSLNTRMPIGLVSQVSWFPGLPQLQHQRAMRCSIRQMEAADSVEGTLATLS